MDDEIKIERVAPFGDGILWPIEAKTIEEAWQIMRRDGMTKAKRMTRNELKKLFPDG